MIKTIYCCDRCKTEGEDKKDFKAVGIYVNPELHKPTVIRRPVFMTDQNTCESLWCNGCVVKYQLVGYLDGLASDQKKAEAEKPQVGFGEQIEGLVEDMVQDAIDNQ